MANTITNLIPSLYQALDVVSRELVGFIPSVSLDSGVERAAVGQSVLSFVTPAATAGNITPGVTPPDDGDQTIGNVDVQITKARRVPVRWNGEQTRGLNANGPGQANIMRDQFAQAMRTLTNEMEADLAALHVFASRSTGDGGTTPFASTLADSAQIVKLLSDNGAPGGNRQLVINTTSGAALRTLGQLTKVNEAGNDSMLRQGILLDIHGMAIRESAQVLSPASGTGTGYTIDTTNYAVGATSIALITGTGTILAGDVIRFTGDPNDYVVKTGIAAPGTIVLQEPGLRQALTTDTTPVTVEEQGARNMGFARSAIVLATRAPALPPGGDLATDRTTITDPRSGISFEVAMYPQYRQMQYEISAAWGVKAVKPEHIALLLG